MSFSPQELIVIAVMLTAVILIFSNRLRPDVTAILVLVTLGGLRIVTPEQALSGFSSSAVITIMGMFVISQALEDTGVVQWLADKLRTISGGNERNLVFIFMIAGALMSLFMNNIAAGAVLLPVAVQVSQESNVRTSKILIPLAFGVSAGGMATYFTTANIIIGGVLQAQTQQELGVFDFFPTGSLIIVAAVIFMTFWGRRILPEREGLVTERTPNALSRDLYQEYQLQDRLWEVRVLPNSRLVDAPLSKSHIGEELGLNVMAIWRGHEAILTPGPNQRIQADDYLLILGREDRLHQMLTWGVALGRGNTLSRDYSVDLTEVVIPPRSDVLGNSLTQIDFRNKYGLTSVALWRNGRSWRTDVGKMPLQVGDALLMVGPVNKIKLLSQDRNYLVLRSSHTIRPPSPQQAPWALLITVIVLMFSIFGLIPMAEAMLLGASALVITKCVNMDDAYRAIEWRIVFLIAGMLPLSIAITETGLGERIGTAIIALFLPYGQLALVGGMFLFAMLMTQVLAGQVAALILGPIAVSVALEVGINPQGMAVAIAIACSTAFITPISHAVNLLMMGPGNYVPKDFFKIGTIMTLITFLITLLGMYLFFGIH